MKSLLYNAIIINEGRRFKGFLQIEGGFISYIGKGCPEKSLINEYGETAVDLCWNWLLPGVIDSHVHFREPGMTHKADIYSESRAALAGGVTSFLEMPNTKPLTLSMSDIDAKADIASKNSLVNYAFFIGASNDNFEELKKVDYRRVPGIKVFLGSSTGNMCLKDSERLDEIFALPHLIAVHCEDESVINRNLQEVVSLYGKNPIPLAWHPVVRSELACYKSTYEALKRAERLKTRLHVCHVTTEEELKILEGRENITLEACIPHLWFTDKDYDRLGAFIKCNPAIKSSRHRSALREGLSTGAINTVNTDHAPHTFEEKEGDLISSPSGIPSIQFSLRLMLKLASKGILSVEQVVRLMCHNQAEIFGISNRGYIREGYYADIVEVNPNGCTRPIDREDVVSKCGWSPYIGETLEAKINRVWVNGHLSYLNGKFTETSSALPLSFSNK